MPRHTQVLTELSTATDYVLHHPQPEPIAGSSLNRAVYQHRSSQELWLAQSPVRSDVKLTQQVLLRKKIARDNQTRKLKIPRQLCCVPSSSGNYLSGWRLAPD